jgi:ribose/xylose/arabinose/galactoside ABC-type transport system permease subunit
MYLSAVTAGVLIPDHGFPVGPALGVCLFVGLLFGAVNALLVTKVRLIPFIATLATLVAGRGLGLFLTRSEPLAFPDSVLTIGSTSLFGVVPLPIAIFAVVVFAAQLFLSAVPRGRQLYAVGHDPDTAVKAGIPAEKVRATAYLACGFLAALGGFVSVAQLGNVNSGFGEFDEFDAIAAAVLGGASLFGGKGSVFPGTVLGVVLIQMVAVGLVAVQVDLYIQPMLEAGIIFFAVFLDSLRNRLLARLGRRPIRTEAG